MKSHPTHISALHVCHICHTWSVWVSDSWKRNPNDQSFRPSTARHTRLAGDDSQALAPGAHGHDVFLPTSAKASSNELPRADPAQKSPFILSDCVFPDCLSSSCCAFLCFFFFLFFFFFFLFFLLFVFHFSCLASSSVSCSLLVFSFSCLLLLLIIKKPSANLALPCCITIVCWGPASKRKLKNEPPALKVYIYLFVFE